MFALLVKRAAELADRRPSSGTTEEALAGWTSETSAVNTPLTDSDQLERQVDGFSLFAIGRWRRHSRTPKLIRCSAGLVLAAWALSLRNDQARSERSGRAVGVLSLVAGNSHR